MSQTKKHFIPTWSSRFLGKVQRHDLWIPEVLSMISSIIVIAVIAGVLRVFDGQTHASWSAPFSLNAFLSGAVSILYLVLMSLISSCVRQLRWVHFRDKNPLADFQAFDKVNHGPMHSLALLLSPLTTYITGKSATKFWGSFDRFLIALAAILVMIAAAIGPLTQLLLSQEITDIAVTAEATIFAAQNLTTDTVSSLTGLPKGVEVNIYDFEAISPLTMQQKSIFTSSLVALKPTNYSATTVCPTSNCTWSEYGSFLVRSQVKNATDSMVFANDSAIERWFSNLTATSAPLWSGDQATPGVDRSTLDGNVTSGDLTLVELSTDGDIRTPLTAEFLLDNVLNQTIDGLPCITPTGSNCQAEWIVDLLVIIPTYNPFLYGKPLAFNSTSTLFHIYYLEMRMNGVTSSTGYSNFSISYENYAAWSCEFDIVAQQYEAVTTNGVLIEHPIGNSTILDSQSCDLSSIDAVPFGDCILSYLLHGSNYSISFLAFHDIFSEIYSQLSYSFAFEYTATLKGSDSLFEALYNHTPEAGDWSKPGQTVNGAAGEPNSVLWYPYWLASYEGRRKPSTDPANSTQTAQPLPKPPLDMSEMMENVANSLTTWMRSSQASAIPGTAYRSMPVYVVTWGWIAFPVALVAVTFMLFVFTVSETRKYKVPIWSDSIIAVMVHCTDIDTRQKLCDLPDGRGLDDAAASVYVQLHGNSLMHAV